VRLGCDGGVEMRGDALAQANARILIEVYLSERLPLPTALRRVLKRKAKSLTLPLPITMPVAA